MKIVPFSKIRKKDFEAYEKARKSGKFNMVTDCLDAESWCGLDHETFWGVLSHYRKLCEKWPFVRGQECLLNIVSGKGPFGDDP